MPGVENMYVPPNSGQPFTAKSVVTWTSRDQSSSHVAFMSMVARDSSGKIYFESRRTPHRRRRFSAKMEFHHHRSEGRDSNNVLRRDEIVQD
jgi:hypothetical protein